MVDFLKKIDSCVSDKSFMFTLSSFQLYIKTLYAAHCNLYAVYAERCNWTTAKKNYKIDNCRSVTKRITVCRLLN